ncbi:MAG: transcriptional regulator [Anaerolineaceae bacterium]|nr:transcriptional regulator [Anaerolineaceae bacterium]
MNEVMDPNASVARQRFEQARRRAALSQVSARLTGEDIQLLPFEAIRTQLQQQNPYYRGVVEVPLDAIVGSVGRYKTFTRKFLPLTDSVKDRWVAVDALAARRGWPPVELYQVGNVYFVKDGNHRVSVARQLELNSIEAHVLAYPVDVTIDPKDNLDHIFIQLGEQSFMASTRLADRYPDHQIRFTSPGRYTELMAQIHGLRQVLAQIDGEMLDWETAVDAWYEMVYLPTVQIIQDSTLLHDFPGRTEADLFAWLSQHRERLEERYGTCKKLAELAQLLADEYREPALPRLTRQVRRLLGVAGEPPSLPAIEEVLGSDLAPGEDGPAASDE